MTATPNVTNAAPESFVVPAGEPLVADIRAKERFRIIDLEGNQAVDTLFYNADRPRERYDVQRTIRKQTNLYLNTGSILYSNFGAPMATITADTCGSHDTVGGSCAQETNVVRYALDTFHMYSCRQSFLLGALHDGRLRTADIGHNINFFMNVPITPGGDLTFADGISGPGKYVELEAHMNLIVLISNCPQLNNPCNAYNPTPIELAILPP